jgi:hypothetical protein
MITGLCLWDARWQVEFEHINKNNRRYAMMIITIKNSLIQSVLIFCNFVVDKSVNAKIITQADSSVLKFS